MHCSTHKNLGTKMHRPPSLSLPPSLPLSLASISLADGFAKKTIGPSQTEATHQVSVLFTTELRPFTVRLPVCKQYGEQPRETLARPRCQTPVADTDRTQTKTQMYKSMLVPNRDLAISKTPALPKVPHDEIKRRSVLGFYLFGVFFLSGKIKNTLQGEESSSGKV